MKTTKCTQTYDAFFVSDPHDHNCFSDYQNHEKKVVLPYFRMESPPCDLP